MTLARRQLMALIERGAIADKQVVKAVQAAELYPSGRAWQRFMDRLLLWLGSLALACAMLFFVAYHWVEMGRLWRLGMVQASLVLAIVVYWRAAEHTVLAQVALLTAALLLGVLLGLFGQVYQTGADTWQLFFVWALLLLPWALLGRQAALWVVWLTLGNLAILLYFQVWRGEVWGGVLAPLLGVDYPVLWPLFAFNTLALAVWELAARRWHWLAVQWPRRLLALGGGIAVTLLIMVYIGRYSTLPDALALSYPLWLVALYMVYRRWRRELFMLSIGCLSIIAVITYWLADNLFDYRQPGSLLLMAAVILGLSALASVWLKRVQRESEA